MHPSCAAFIALQDFNRRSCLSPKRQAPSVDFRSTSEFITGSPCHPAGCPAGRTTLPLLDFLALRHSLKLADTCLGSRSLRCPGPRARFGYLLRGSYHQPSRRFRIGASMGFALQGVPFAAIGTPLGAHALLPLPVPRCCSEELDLGTQPASGPCSCDESVQSPTPSGAGRRSLPGVRPSRVFSHPTWRSLWSRRLPSRPLTA